MNPVLPPYDSNQIRQEIISTVRAQKSIEAKSSKELLLEAIDTEKKSLRSDTLKIRQRLNWASIKSRKVIVTAMAAMIVIALTAGDKPFLPGKAQRVSPGHI